MTSEHPAWLDRVVDRAATEPPDYFRRYAPPDGGTHRRSAVLMLVGPHEHGEDIVLTRRAASLRTRPQGRAQPRTVLAVRYRSAARTSRTRRPSSPAQHRAAATTNTS